MHAITTVLVLLLAVAASDFLVRLVPFNLPLPVVQIAVGAALAFFIHFEVPLDPDIFFLLFVPPLLFLDGWRIPKDAFFRDLKAILTLAIGLVVFTVAGAGMLIDWLVPAMPTAVAFALAAILSPTDPVAVSAIASRAPIPGRLMHILEGESLLNDASGLVCFQFAVAAALTGGFSLLQASGAFVAVAGVGFGIGVAVAWGVGAANRWLVQRTVDEPAVQLLISLLIPFAAYLAAERAHVSGILAAAAAGITMQYVDVVRRPRPATRIERQAVWNALQMALNGTAFVMVGEQLPRIFRDAKAIAAGVGLTSAWPLLGYAVVVALALTALRFAWVSASLWFTLFRSRGRRADLRNPSWRVAALAAFAGVRGAVTLAGILTLPLFMPEGRTPFPARDLAILLAMGVILLSLAMASVALPLLARGIEFDPGKATAAEQESDALDAAAQAAIRRIEALCQARSGMHDDREAAQRILDDYRRRLRAGSTAVRDTAAARERMEAERRLRLEALRAERDELYRLNLSRKLNDTSYRRLVRQLDHMETAVSRPRKA